MHYCNDFSFATARMMSRQFSAHPTAIKEILRRDLGLKKLARKSVPHQFDPSQKVQRVEAAKFLFQIVRMLQPNTIDVIAAGDGS
jgi:hypothetical protein